MRSPTVVSGLVAVLVVAAFSACQRPRDSMSPASPSRTYETTSAPMHRDDPRRESGPGGGGSIGPTLEFGERGPGQDPLLESRPPEMIEVDGGIRGGLDGGR